MPRELQPSRSELADWKQAAGVEAGLRREFLARANKAEAEIERLRAFVLKLADMAHDAFVDGSDETEALSEINNTARLFLKNGDRT